MRVDQLLNPVETAGTEEWTSVVTTVPQVQAAQPPPRSSHQSPRSREQKLPKDAPIFRKGDPKGSVQFPPHEAGDDVDLKEQHRLFQVYPLGEIADYCHHIPYSSDKKTFLSKTGRDAFEVFQYTFKLPEEDKEYAVMWDYNIGLVRITPFFKCCKYSKTTPAKVLNGNPGLREISHSITGGALAAQGYWMPFECAKAVAATFCYNVRYALTPLFGKDFPDICIQPIHPNYGNFKIDKTIIDHCTNETQCWLQRSDARLTPAPSSREASATPSTPKLNGPLAQWKKLKPKLVHKDATSESGYGTDTDWSESSKFSPQVSPKTTWPSVNRSWTTHKRECSADEVTAAQGLINLASPTRIVKQQIPRSYEGDPSHPKRPITEVEEEYGDDERSSADEDRPVAPLLTAENKKLRSTDTRTAHLLLQLKLDKFDTFGKEDVHRGKRTRTRSL